MIDKSKKVNINGVTYRNIEDAASNLGVCRSTIGKWNKKLGESCRSEIDFMVKIPQTFTIKKIKES